MTASTQIKNNKYYTVLNWVSNGKRKQKWISTGLSVDGNNKRKAEKHCKDELHKLEETLSLSNYEEMLFSDFMRKWLEDIKRNISETTYHVYKNVVCGVICPYFDKLKINLADLKAYHIQDFYIYKMEHDGVTANTIHHYHANIHKALQYAVKTERIKSNPANLIDLPKKQKHIADFYTADELKLLIRAAMGTTLEPVVLIAAWFGLRRGEIIGLKWDCIDFENQTITIKGTMAKTNKMIYKETAKNNSSLRTLPMPDEASDYFHALMQRQKINRLQYGKRYNHQWKDFICVKPNGDILRLDYVSTYFPKLCEENGLRKIHLHELRHSNISLLIGAGASMKEVQEWAGHSTYTTTADIYAHIQSENKRKLSNTIGDLLSEKPSVRNPLEAEANAG